jgi:hypothetical protein
MKTEIMKITDNPNLGMKKPIIFFPFFKTIFCKNMKKT